MNYEYKSSYGAFSISFTFTEGKTGAGADLQVTKKIPSNSRELNST